MTRLLPVAVPAVLAAACARPQPAAVAVAPAATNRTALPFPWWPGEVDPIRITLLRHDGQPMPCVTFAGEERPCDIEVTEADEVYYRRYSEAPAGEIGPGLSLRREGVDGLSLDESGAVLGRGLFHPPDAAQVLFCEMTAEPALRCAHDFSAAKGTPIWNEQNCGHSFVLRVDGDAIVVAFPQHEDVPSVIAHVDPAPSSDGAEALALFLYAMELVTGDTTYHTPYVSDMHGHL
jgi:hypothetical protein